MRGIEVQNWIFPSKNTQVVSLEAKPKQSGLNIESICFSIV